MRQSAAAAASASSGRKSRSTESRVRIILTIMSLSARPVPVTASLISEGVNSSSASFASPQATIAAPRACPSRRVLCGLTFTNTRSIAASSGACRAITSESPVVMAQRRSTMAASFGGSMTPEATSAGSRAERTSRIAQPVWLSPGSMPRTRRGDSVVNVRNRPCRRNRPFHPCRPCLRGRRICRGLQGSGASCRSRPFSCAS